MSQLEFAARGHGLTDDRATPDGLRKLLMTPTCERCRRGETFEVRSVDGTVTALCRGCSSTAPRTRSVAAPVLAVRRPIVPAVSIHGGLNSVARARLALAELESGYLSQYKAMLKREQRIDV